MGKLSPKWIALCTATIGLAYTAGYIVTEPKAVAVSSAVQANVNPVQTQPSSNTSDQSSQSSSTASSSTASSSQPAQNKSGYKDGTFSGQGMNRIGSVAVSVTIKQGKITNVQITDCTTSYPQSLIDPLPGQVVSRQNVSVDNVSGATESTDDFVTAVTQALQQAKA
ncbi:FMN-binding protein [Sporolactobacillus shoreae]|uniref:FMN-binding protein n=1 Tax=Sporolactobacillus shoreae TaxID=1465501 RepID=A0A4Z0GP88_9BACL|nr:FMN-binding protein [Sporolactobacillus shoreae]TGA98190.1 FMN-binding protein [Sporolactobacillus shoreae]